MSWATDRLQYLSTKYTYREIYEYTGIPISTLSYVIRGERQLRSQYILNVRALYERTTYQALRDAGLSASQARMYRSRSVERTIKAMQQVNTVIDALARYRLPKYIEYLKSRNAFKGESETLDILRQAIAKSFGRSPYEPEVDDAGKDSPTLRHVLDTTP